MRPLILALLAFLFYSFLTQNLPFGIGDELNSLRLTEETPWSALLKEALHPMPPVWQVNALENLLNTRAFNTVIYKILHTLWPYSWEAFHLFKNVCFGAFIFFFGLLMRRFGVSKAGAGLASVMVILAPPVYESVYWTVEYEIVAQLFMVIAFFAFASLYFNQDTYSRGWFAGTCVLFLWSAWWANENRETTRMIPVVIFGFLILQKGLSLWTWARSSGRARAILACAAGTFLFIIPRQISKAAPAGYQASGFDPHFENWIQLFRQFQSGALLGKFHSLGEKIPVLAAAALLGFGVWVFVTYAVMKRKTVPGTSGDGTGLRFGLPWLAISSFPLFLNLEIQRRYFTLQIIPFAFIFAVIFSMRDKRPLLRNALWTSLLTVFFLGWSAAGLAGILYLRFKMNHKDIAAFHMAARMAEDYTGRPAENPMRSVYEFYATDKILPRGEYNLIKINDWDYPGLTLEAAREKIGRMVSERGVAYLIVREGSVAVPAGGESLGTISSMNDSLFCRLLASLGKKTPSYDMYRYR